METTNMITIKSTVKAQVSISVPSLNLRRFWPKVGAIQRIPFDLLEQAIYEPGVEYLFKTGILYIDDMETKIKLGLEEPEAKEPQNIIVLSDADKDKLLTGTALKDFREKVEKLSIEQARELAQYAIDKGITDYQRCEIMKKASRIDVLKCVMQNLDDKRKNETEAAQE